MIRFVVALECEAKPLIGHYRLKRDHRESAFQLYHGTDMTLIVAGIGRANVAAACGYLAGSTGDQQQSNSAAWLNVGIGGHREYDCGDMFVAHRIDDTATGARWYPPIIVEPPCRTATVVTVDRAESEFPDDSIYDMEAASYFPVACRFATSELVQVAKVISDNRQTTLEKLTAERITKLIAENIQPIHQLAQQTASLAAELSALQRDPPHYQTCIERWRFSQTQRNQLRRLLRRFNACFPQAEIPFETFAEGKTVLDWLQGAMR